MVVCVDGARAAVVLPPIISSHMVLQRGVAAPIWGKAAAGEKITVKFRNQVKTTEADKDGGWLVKLDPLDVGAPAALTVSGTNTITLEDVLVGEVWVGSGQSNMAMTAGSYTAGDPPLARMVGESYPQVRLASGRGAWQPATPQSMKSFSALLLAFGVPLHKQLNVPVGLIVGAVGGTPSGYWVTQDMLDADAAVKAAAAKWDAANPLEPRQKAYEQDLAKFQSESPELARADVEAKRPAAMTASRSRTQPANVPLVAGKKPPQRPVAPSKGGTVAGVGHLYEKHIKPIQPYAIRGVLWDQGEGGTALNGVDQYVTMGALIEGWRKAWGQGEFPFIYVQKPSGGGYAWPSASSAGGAGATTRTTAAPARVPPLPPTVPHDGTHRATHIRIMEYSNTAMVISSDLGGGTHPTSKSSYGHRAVLVALGMVYGQKVEYYGPLYASHKVEGTAIRVSFTHIGAGLACPEGQLLQGFAVAGEDKVFHWAKATIDGDTVVVTSEKVAKPVALRYAWSQTYPWANLFNKDGLPAVPFRTDRW